MTVVPILFTASYDSKVRLWYDLEQHQISMTCKDLPGHAPSMDIFVGHDGAGIPWSFIVTAGARGMISAYTLGTQSLHIDLSLQRSSNKSNQNVTCVRFSNEADNHKHLFATSYDAKVFLVMTSLIKQKFSADQQQEFMHNTGREIAAVETCELTPRHTRSDKNMGSLDYAATSCSVYRNGIECFVSDTHGQIWFWSPKADKESWLTLLYRNERTRPIQSIACDPCGEFLVATDWDGLIYFFSIKIVNESTDNDVVTSTVELIELTEPGWPYKAPTTVEKVYGLRVCWCHDAQRFAVSQSSGIISLFEMESAHVPRLLDNLVAGDETKWVWDLSFDSTGNFLVSGNSGGIVKLWKQNDSPTAEGPRWKCLKHREIKLQDFMDGRNTGVAHPSPTISSLIYRELPICIYEEMKQNDKVRQHTRHLRP
ncbi:Oidioi.mRNA.OKI2018_I69.XSR.g13874.t1.cds [Oikopleura dioica]|uniref:Target of rapamycin complex subunit lst8 n=1 Tax=Oikopleura dioica TaxID=34765 RepID=A0ABN7SDA2_OIKDI|nr:Oidioi.mRNA.OKI2018_I69.XSR.g13874.t1.cds [Oikopleura dioica]